MAPGSIRLNFQQAWEFIDGEMEFEETLIDTEVVSYEVSDAELRLFDTQGSIDFTPGAIEFPPIP